MLLFVLSNEMTADRAKWKKNYSSSADPIYRQEDVDDIDLTFHKYTLHKDLEHLHSI